MVRELDLLRATNEKLRDDRDALELSLKGSGRTQRTKSWADEVEAMGQRGQVSMNKIMNK